MAKIMVATHRENDPLWQDWSQAAAYAESLTTDSPQAAAAWERADALWAQWEAAQAAARLAEVRAMLDEHYESMAVADLEATQDDASWRAQ